MTEADSSAARDASTKKSAAKKSATGTTAKKKSPPVADARKLARSAPTSKYFGKARTRARTMLNDPEALRLIADESHKRGAAKTGPFVEVMEDFRVLVRLVVAYSRGNYRDIKPDSLVLVVAGLIYVVSPIDLIPDAIPGVGFLDDAMVVGWVITSVRQELDKFRAWELGQ